MTDTTPKQPEGDKKPLIEFPCDFPIKVMGARSDDFASIVTGLVQQYQPDFDPASMTVRESSGGKYTGLTVTVHVDSQEQLDNIYRALTGNPLCKYVL